MDGLKGRAGGWMVGDGRVFRQREGDGWRRQDGRRGRSVEFDGTERG